eukprot:gene2575-2817_t
MQSSAATRKSHADALQSKAMVESLKARGVTSGRKARKMKETVEVATCDSNQTAPEHVFLTMISALNQRAFDLLQDVERFQSLTEKKSTHFEGFEVSLKGLRKVSLLSQIIVAVMTCTSTSPGIAATDTTISTPSQNPINPPIVSISLPGTESLLEELRFAGAFLLRQELSALTLFALSCGFFALAVDCSRALIKNEAKRSEQGLWVMRGLSFAGMGSAYLARLHCQSARKFSESNRVALPGLDSVLAWLEDVEHKEAIRRMEMSTVEHVDEEIRRGLYFLAGYQHCENGFLMKHPDLQEVDIEDFRYLLQPDLNLFPLDETLNKERGSRETILMIRNLLRSWIARQANLQNKSLFSTSAKLVANTTLHKLWIASRRSLSSSKSDDQISSLFVALAILEIQRRLFYEAQMLFLEGLLKSAEYKYIAVHTLGTALLSQDGSVSEELLALVELLEVDVVLLQHYLKTVLSACEVNIERCAAATRVTKADRGPSHLFTGSTTASTAPSLLRSTNLFMQCDRQASIVLIVAFTILSNQCNLLNRWKEAARSLKKLEALLSQNTSLGRTDCTKECNGFVGSYIQPLDSSSMRPLSPTDAMNLQGLSQLFLTGAAIPIVNIRQLPNFYARTCLNRIPRLLLTSYEKIEELFSSSLLSLQDTSGGSSLPEDEKDLSILLGSLGDRDIPLSYWYFTIQRMNRQVDFELARRGKRNNFV